MFSKLNKSARTAPSIICGNCHIAGNLTGQGELQIDGKVDGNVQCEGLVVGKGGSITGDIRADRVLILGNVTGQISARDIVLAETARILGDVAYDTLSIANGARVESRFHHMPQSTPQPIAAEREFSPQSILSDPSHANVHARRERLSASLSVE